MSSVSNNLSEIPFSGKSMSWFLFEGDKLLLDDMKSHYEVGDLIVFRYEGELSCHRIIDISTDRIRCKGDFSINSEFVRREFIIGKVVGIKRDGATFFYNKNSIISFLYKLFSFMTSHRKLIRYAGIVLIYTLQKIDFTLNMKQKV